MSDYRVNLDIFAGPLDLLLYLVRKEEVDIYDIPIAKITDQYIRYIELMKSFDIDLAGDFLVMAATLMQIKSAMLLPKADTDAYQDDDLTDPRTELVRQLLEYKKFKDAANLLDAAAGEQRERYPRPGTIVERLKPDAEPELDIEQVSVWDLLEAFDTICKAIGTVGVLDHIKDDTPIDLYQIEILHRLQTEGPMIFERIFEIRSSRVVMIGLFLALLELIREKLIWVEQPANKAIFLRSLTDEPAEQAVQKAILAAVTGGDESDRDESQASPPIPITELPSKNREIILSDAQSQFGIPIVELPSEGKSAVPSRDQQVHPTHDPEHQIAN
ncbi:MAG: segregation/condensation protein A [Sedimentisphaerales bacterium]|nr:segregation/condensation protein A [Sedimentisphaerales bacterium]